MLLLFVAWRFSLRGSDSATAERWLLHIGNKSLDAITLYTPDGRGGFTERRAGDGRPFYTRAFRHRDFVFRLAPLPEGVHTYYLRIASNGPLFFPAQIVAAELFFQRDRVSQFILGAFFGIMLVMALYHFLLFLSIRDVTYLYYVLFIVSFILYELSVERIGFEYLWPNNLWWAERANSTLALVCAVAGIVFSRRFLGTKEYAPPWDRALMLLAVLCVPLILVRLGSTGPAVNRIVVLFFLGAIGVMAGAGLAVLRQGNRAARYYLIAWSFFIAGIFLSMLGYLNVLPPYHFVSMRGVQVGAALEVTLLSLGLGYRYNAMRKARERLRLRIASDLHDDVGSGLTQISLCSELLRHMPDPKTAGLAEQIGVQARSLAGTMQDIVWAVEPKQDSWEALELRMKDFAAGLLAPAGIAFDMQGERRQAHGKLPLEVRQNVLLMFKEALHNAVKHARCTQVTVRWRLTRRTLWLRVWDDGEGFDPQAVARGNGLHNLRRRADDLSARFALEARPGQPTALELEVPL